MSEKKDLLDPANNDLIPQDPSPSLGLIVTMSLEQMADALASSGGYPEDLGDGLKVDRQPVGNGEAGLRVFRNGVLTRDLFTLTTEELEKVRKFLESRGNDLIPSE